MTRSLSCNVIAAIELSCMRLFRVICHDCCLVALSVASPRFEGISGPDFICSLAVTLLLCKTEVPAGTFDREGLFSGVPTARHFKQFPPGHHAMTDKSKTLYFEPQESLFCAVHCVNNLLQGPW